MGVFNMKKLEPMINTISPVISYLFRGNTDVINLRSGMALKAVILHMSDDMYNKNISQGSHDI